MAATGRRAVVRAAEHVAQVEVAEHLVERRTGHRVAGVGLLDDDGDRLGEAHVAAEEDDVASRLHHLAERAVAGLEDVVDESSLALGDVLVAGDHHPQLLLVDLVAGGVGVAAEEADEQVGRERQQPDDRCHHGGELAERRREELGDPHRALQREPLGHELTEDQRQVRHDEGGHDQRHRVGRRGAEALEDGREGRCERRGTEGGGEEARHRDADLHGREEPVGVAGEGGDRVPAAPLGVEALHLSGAQRDQRDLGRREHTAHQDERENEQDVDPRTGFHPATTYRVATSAAPTAATG